MAAPCVQRLMFPSKLRHYGSQTLQESYAYWPAFQLLTRPGNGSVPYDLAIWE